MRWPRDEKRAQPAGNGCAPLDFIALGSNDRTVDSLQAPKKQASHPHRAVFARAAVFEEFQYRHARAIDYGGFVDRRPNQAPRRWTARP